MFSSIWMLIRHACIDLVQLTGLLERHDRLMTFKVLPIANFRRWTLWGKLKQGNNLFPLDEILTSVIVLCHLSVRSSLHSHFFSRNIFWFSLLLISMESLRISLWGFRVLQPWNPLMVTIKQFKFLDNRCDPTSFKDNLRAPPFIKSLPPLPCPLDDGFWIPPPDKDFFFFGDKENTINDS